VATRDVYSPLTPLSQLFELYPYLHYPSCISVPLG
jgi:hypothetical protein